MNEAQHQFVRRQRVVVLARALCLNTSRGSNPLNISLKDPESNLLNNDIVCVLLLDNYKWLFYGVSGVQNIGSVESYVF